MTNVQKNEIVNLMELEAANLGSRNKLAVKLNVSSATVSQIINGNWDNIKDEMFAKIGRDLGYNFSGWQIAETSSFKQVLQVLHTAQQNSLFIPISERAGMGKTEPAKVFTAANRGSHVYRLLCDEWAKREFLQELCNTLGISIPNGVISIYKLGQLVIDYFSKISHKKPLLIIDEADKLKAPALRFLIPMFNALEDKIGVVILGTENLEKEIKKGVRLNRKGYDEIDSRFGRNYIHLLGATKNDVAKICEANSITDKAQHTEIFNECNPVKKLVEAKDGQKTQVTVIEDLRRLKRVIIREQLKKTA